VKGALFVCWAVAVAGCGTAPPKLANEVRPIDEDQLALLPAGAEAVVDLDLAELRDWAPARRLWALLPDRERAQVAAMGIDPVTDLDGLVLSLGQVEGELSSTMLLRGEIDLEKMAHALGDAPAAAEYHGAALREAGARAVARLSPRLVVLGTRTAVRQVIDLSHGEGESVRRADRQLVAAFARAPSAKTGRPALIAALAPSEEARAKLFSDGLPGRSCEWFTFVLAVGDGFDFEIIGHTHGEAEAQTLVASGRQALERFRARPSVRILGLQPFLQSIVVAARGEEARLVYRLPSRRVEQLFARLESMATTPPLPPSPPPAAGGAGR
jgi:hypothetical protein